jgi:hypothetical protein
MHTNQVRRSGADGRADTEPPTGVPWNNASVALIQSLHSITATNHCIIIIEFEETGMAKGEQKGNRESKKPKKEKIKTIAAAPSQKTAGWQPNFASGKKK